MNLNQIQSFIAASEQGNLRRAAETLGVTQPTLSARIRVLEEQLGTQLFERTPVGVELTEAGRRWLPHARTMMIAWDNGTRALSVAHGLKGRKCFGLHEYLVQGYTAPIMAALQNAWPDHAIHLQTQVSAELVERVVAGTLDAALIYDSRPHRDVAFHLIWKQDIQLFTTGDPNDPATAFFDIDWGAEFPAFLQRFLSGHPAGSLSFGSPAAAISYLAKNDGCAFLDKLDIELLGESGWLERADYPENFLRPVYLVHRKSDQMGELVHSLIAGVDTVLKTQSTREVAPNMSWMKSQPNLAISLRSEV